jgi:protein O-GlcNAc transferase
MNDNILIQKEADDMTSSISSLLFYDQFNEAIDTCLKSLEGNQNCLIRQFQLGLSLFLAGQEDSAQEVWMESIIQEDAEDIDRNTEALKQFLIEETHRKIKNNKDNQAGQIIAFLIEIDSENLWLYEELGNIFFRNKSYTQAIDTYLKAIFIEPNSFSLFNKIGDSYFSIDDVENAINWYNKALALNSNHVGTLLQIALALKTKGDFNKAKDYLHKAILLEGEIRIPFSLMSEICKEQGELVEASLYEGLHSACNHKYEKAASELSVVLGSKFQSDRVFRTLYECYIRSGKYHEAAETIQQALRIYPNDITLRIKDKFVLPHLYESVDEVKLYREKYINGLTELIKDLAIDGLNMASALKAVSVHVNFYLSYQGYDDSLLQKKYGNFLHSVMQSNFPDWSRTLPIQKIESSRRLRVGYLSYFFQEHTVCKLFKGWIRHANRGRFEIFTYHLGFGNDSFTQEIQNNSDHFYHYPSGFEEICQRILEDKLDILVYPEIGMDSRTMKLAALRLAPVQCMSWGHPVTSGLTTIDYFLSSELMEPEDAQAHYSENLVQLPNLGISYALPSMPKEHLPREYFGVGSDKIVYLSCQSIFKYLPQYDYIFAAIAQQVSNAQFVFISPYSSSLAEQFIQRVGRAFKAIGLNHQDYCIVVPRQDKTGYLSLNLIADVFLDTLAWTGGNTTLEAIACDLPVVTYPGQFMRGRHSYAMLRRMNMTDLIANTELEYIQIASQLGINLSWREKIRVQISQSKSILFEDVDCISTLEQFYVDVCAKRIH